MRLVFIGLIIAVSIYASDANVYAEDYGQYGTSGGVSYNYVPNFTIAINSALNVANSATYYEFNKGMQCIQGIDAGAISFSNNFNSSLTQQPFTTFQNGMSPIDINTLSSAGINTINSSIANPLPLGISGSTTPIFEPLPLGVAQSSPLIQNQTDVLQPTKSNNLP